jgi:hypothetical protein
VAVPTEHNTAVNRNYYTAANIIPHTIDMAVGTAATTAHARTLTATYATLLIRPLVQPQLPTDPQSLSKRLQRMLSSRLQISGTCNTRPLEYNLNVPHRNYYACTVYNRNIHHTLLYDRWYLRNYYLTADIIYTAHF